MGMSDKDGVIDFLCLNSTAEGRTEALGVFQGQASQFRSN